MAYPSVGLALDPQTLAQLAAAAFKPPQPMQMAPLNLNAQVPNLNMGPQQQQGASNGIGAAAAGLGAGIPYIANAFKSDPAIPIKPGEAGLNDFMLAGGTPKASPMSGPSFWSNFNPFSWGA